MPNSTGLMPPFLAPDATIPVQGVKWISLCFEAMQYMPNCTGLMPPFLAPDATIPVQGVKRKRHCVPDACAFCRRSKVKCDEVKPCQRCINHGRADACISWRKAPTDAHSEQRITGDKSSCNQKRSSQKRRMISLSSVKSLATGAGSSAHTIRQKKLNEATVKKISGGSGPVRMQPDLAEASQEMMQDTVRQRRGGSCWAGADQSVTVAREQQSRHRSTTLVNLPADVLRAGSHIALHRDDECPSLSWVDNEELRLESGHQLWEGAADVEVSSCVRLQEDFDLDLPTSHSEFESDLDPVLSLSPSGVDTWIASLSQPVASSDSEATDVDAKWLDHLIGQTPTTPLQQTGQAASKTASDDARDLLSRNGPGCIA